MLVLSRLLGQRIEIGDPNSPSGERIVIEVIRFRKSRGVSLGITAPPGTPIHRAEVAAIIRSGVDPQKAMADK